MFTRAARLKATLCTIIFAMAGIGGVARVGDNLVQSAPLILLYFMLVIHAYYSIRAFASVTPATSISQNSIDIILLTLYIVIGANIASYYNFTFFAFLMFVVASIKYILLQKVIDQKTLLKRKTRIDIIGAAGFAFTLLGVMLGSSRQSAWALAIVFAATSIYLLMVRPLYRLDQDQNATIST